MPSPTASAVPIYQRIRDTVRERIESGRYKEGDRLPSETELVDEFGVARMTVRQALTQLVYENLIVRQPGMGTFVAAKKKVVTELDADSSMSFEEQVSAQGRTPALKLLSFGRVPSSPEVADRLNLASGEPVYRLERLRYVDDQLIGLEIRHFIAEVGDRIPMQSIKTMPTFDMLEAALGEPIQTVDVSMFAATASKEMGEKLKLRRGAAILVRDHIVLDSRDRVVLYGNSIYRGNLRFRHVYRRARSRK
jgi:GntR family transcriptional regulator